MKIKTILITLILFLTLIFNIRIAEADSDKAREWAITKGEEILHILANKDLEQKYSALDKILYEDIDLDNAARFVLGRYWRQMNNEQKETYISLFKRYTAALYKSFPLDVPENSINYEIIKILPNKNFYDVYCSINLKNNKQQNTSVKEQNKAKINVIFSLTEKKNKIMVNDLKIGESSLLIAYRDRFYKMIHEDNDDEIEWFLEDLENVTADKEEENLNLLEKNHP